MAKISLDPQELKNQALQMSTLGAEYETLFSGVNSILVNVNSNWSQNLSNNFSGKISAAQRSFSQVTDMLKFGADAANSSAESYENIDIQLTKVMGKYTHFGSSGVLHGGGGASFNRNIHNSSSDTVHSGGKEEMSNNSLLESMRMSIPKKNSETISASYGDDWKEVLEDNYHEFVDGDSDDNSGYSKTTYGTTTGKKKIIGDLYYEKKRDVEEYYVNYKKKSDYENASGKMSRTGEEIIIAQQGCKENVNIKINHVEYRADAKYDPKKGTVYAAAGAEYDVASVGFELGDSEDGLGSVEANLKMGLGGKFEAGVHNGVIKVDAGVALGPGIDVSFEINYKNWKDAFVDAFTFKKD